MTEKKTRIPTPLYAVAGVGDLAYRQLRKLPEMFGELGVRAASGTAELREKAGAALRAANTAAGSLRERASGADFDLARLRELAQRNAVNLLAHAQTAQERAVVTYNALVARGERVIGSAAEATDRPAVESAESRAKLSAAAEAHLAAEVAEPAEPAEPVQPARTTRRARPAKATRTTATGTARSTASTTRRRTRPSEE